MNSVTAAAVPVSIHGFSLNSALLMIIAIINGTAVGHWIKNRPAMRKLGKEADEKLRDDLILRIEKLEQKLDEERASHDAVVSLMRHRLNNSDQCIEALLLVLDDDDLPPKVKRAVAAIKAMRERQRSDEAIEKATIHAARIVATASAEEGK